MLVPRRRLLERNEGPRRHIGHRELARRELEHQLVLSWRRRWWTTRGRDVIAKQRLCERQAYSNEKTTLEQAALVDL